MVLQDLACTACGHVLVDQLVDSTVVTCSCPLCGEEREHRVVLLGGTGPARWRCNDWPADHSRWWEGQVQTFGAEVSHDGENFLTPVQYHSNHKRAGQPVTLNADRSQERRERGWHRYRRAHGQTPIILDGGRRAHRR